MKRLLTAAAVALLCPLGQAVRAADPVVVIDGDTLTVGNLNYRLHGIDAPEAGQRCNEAGAGGWPCGDLATRHLEQLIGNNGVSCDYRGQDEYDRIIAVCWAGNLELNSQMIADGYAWAFRRFSMDYASLEDAVAATRIGIWQAPTETPWDYRARRWKVAAQVAPDGCPIKGNISVRGRIYHTPWSPWYDRTKLSPENGERWFCSEREAIDAGWRAPAWGD